MKDYNYININKGAARLAWSISSKSLFFENEFQCIIDEEKIVFKQSFLHTKGKTQKCVRRNSNWFYISITTDYELPLGKLYFNIDESTEDEIVIYFKNETM